MVSVGVAHSRNEHARYSTRRQYSNIFQACANTSSSSLTSCHLTWSIKSTKDAHGHPRGCSRCLVSDLIQGAVTTICKHVMFDGIT